MENEEITGVDAKNNEGGMEGNKYMYSHLLTFTEGLEG